MKNMNVFIELLRCLNVKYTHGYAMDIYKGNPYHNSLYGLSMMLSHYNVKNTAVEIKNKKQIIDIICPFIAYDSHSFILVKNIKNTYAYCSFNGEEMNISVDEFISIWSGILLVPEVSEESIEPNYHENKVKEFVDVFFLKILYIVLFLGGVLSLIFLGLLNGEDAVLGGVLLFGLYICFLLLQKQMNAKSLYADKLCSLFKKSNCNDILESDASKFLGLFSWSEIGFAYFASTFLICILFHYWLFYCAWISVFALFYTFWSIWYQRFKVKQWCPMCLIVMGIFWLLFIFYAYFGYLTMRPFKLIESFWILLLYVLPFLIVHQFVSILTDSLSKKELMYEVNNIKMNENVFLALLKSNEYYDVSCSTSQIRFGNLRANILISVLTNPHCEPCAKMHYRLNNLLSKTGDKYCLQYVFSSFEESLSVSNKMLIAAFFKYGSVDVMKVYDDWFTNGKYRKEEFFLQKGLLVDSIVENEFVNHEEWIRKNQLRTTPTVLINGYMLPFQYKIEDLEFLEINWT